MEQKKQSILREYIKTILIEDDFGGGDFGGVIGGGLAGATGIGPDIVSGDLIDKTLFKGWRDLFKTATAATKSLSASAIGTAKIALSAVTNTIFPWYKENYKKIFEQHRQVQDRIRQKHAAVYDSIKNALGENHDFIASSIFFSPDKFFNTVISNPSTFIAGVGATKAPDAIASLYDILSGGGMLTKAIENIYTGESGKKVKQVLQKTLSKNVFANIFGQGGEPSDFRAQENVFVDKFPLFEADNTSDLTSLQKEALKILLNPQLIKQVLHTQSVQQIVKDERNATLKMLTDIVNTVRTAMKMQTLDDFAKVTGKQLDLKLDDIPEDMRKKMVDETKESIKKMYAAQLQTMLQEITKVVGKDNDLVKAYQEALKQIEVA